MGGAGLPKTHKAGAAAEARAGRPASMQAGQRALATQLRKLFPGKDGKESRNLINFIRDNQLSPSDLVMMGAAIFELQRLSITGDNVIPVTRAMTQTVETLRKIIQAPGTTPAGLPTNIAIVFNGTEPATGDVGDDLVIAG